MSRREAKKLGLKRYYTGKACKHGHVSERYVSNKHCATCDLNGCKAWNTKNLNKKRAHTRKAQTKFRKTPAGKVIWNRARARYLVKHRNKVLARKLVTNAVRDGRLKRKPCAVCDNVVVEAHHADYSKPLNVAWFCQKHHRDEDKRHVAQAA